ncbi:MAG: nucleotidyltransferase family protein, partial [Oscillospiraceae bacterium]
MKIAGIIAEYNPFHNGHLYQIEKTRLTGATHIVAVISPDFVQRGDIACFDKYSRAEAALENGADLVVELPVQFALASANIFAKKGVEILSQLGVSMISFGSESGDIDKLKNIANMCDSIKNNTFFQQELKKGVSYPKAQTNTIAKLYSQADADILTSPNNLLATEYIRAINEICPEVVPITIPRIGSTHDTHMRSNSVSSATYLRDNLNRKTLKKYVPKSAYNIFSHQLLLNKTPSNKNTLDLIILYKLRTMTKTDLLLLPDVSEGLENRIYEAIKSARTLDEFYSLVKTKRYTLSRIRRIAFCALIGIKKCHLQQDVQYVRVLAAN